ncbi:MAG: TIGR00725 family protein [Candidatus Marinimicrobia bacterium]|nr:TIGR00725 family protein [Candidatus Neomarinimicrobiota bacterium]
MKKSDPKKIISVFGGREADEAQLTDAERIGKAIAEHGWVLLCGGRGGIMEAVSKGCSEAGGLSIGILPGDDRKDANPHIQVPIATGIGLARNAVIARAGDAAVAIGGKYGTLSEIAYALQFGKPVFVLGSWDIPGTIKADTAEELLLLLSRSLKNRE